MAVPGGAVQGKLGLTKLACNAVFVISFQLRGEWDKARRSVLHAGPLRPGQAYAVSRRLPCIGLPLWLKACWKRVGGNGAPGTRAVQPRV